LANVTIDNVVKRYGATQVMHGVSVDIEDGEFVVLVGPSGCGKSTLLRMLAGLEEISEGTVSIGDKVVNDVLPKERDIAMVFQSYALYPHKTVFMGRAIVRDPQVFLFDEPLSNLDAKLRVTMRVEIKELHQRLGTTIVYVTHDQIEAMTMADKIVVMRDGRVEQVGSPLDLYDHPNNVFVADIKIDALVKERISARPASELGFVFDPGKAHLFDRTSARHW